MYLTYVSDNVGDGTHTQGGCRCTYLPTYPALMANGALGPCLICIILRSVLGTSTAVLSFLKKEDVSIAFLQQTHLEDKDNAKLQRSWVEHVFATSYSSFSRGVAILISKKLAFRSLDCVKGSQDQYIIGKGILAGKEVTFMNLYCPPAYSPGFLSKAFAVFMERALLFCGRRFHLSP